MCGDFKQPVTTEWVERIFGSFKAWQKSLTGFRAVRVGPKRREVIHIRLVRGPRSTWRLPCPDRPIPDQVRATVADSVLGFGPRPRVAYRVGDLERMAVGRRGESSERLRAELQQLYGPVWMVDVPQENDAVAEWVATGGNYRPHARRLGIRDQRFLAKAIEPEEVERSAVLSDRQFERVWLARSVYSSPEEGTDVVYGDPGEWAADDPDEVVIADPGGKPEAPPPLPMAIPKVDGRGRHNLYFGHALDYGGGHRWSVLDFEPPLKIALGGLLNRQLGFGGSERVDEALGYQGDGFHWGRFQPLAPRLVEPWWHGPVCRRLSHPEPMATKATVPEANRPPAHPPSEHTAQPRRDDGMSQEKEAAWIA